MAGFRPMSIEEIGGAKVTRRFTRGAESLMAGRQLTQDELRTFPIVNLNALVENRFLQVWPKATAVPAARQTSGAAAPPAGSMRRMFMTGFGRYTVVEGLVLGDKLTKEEAQALIAAPPGVAPLPPKPPRVPNAHIAAEPQVHGPKRGAKAARERRALGRGVQSIVDEIAGAHGPAEQVEAQDPDTRTLDRGASIEPTSESVVSGAAGPQGEPPAVIEPQGEGPGADAPATPPGEQAPPSGDDAPGEVLNAAGELADEVHCEGCGSPGAHLPGCPVASMQAAQGGAATNGDDEPRF